MRLPYDYHRSMPQSFRVWHQGRDYQQAIWRVIEKIARRWAEKVHEMVGEASAAAEGPAKPELKIYVTRRVVKSTTTRGFAI